MIPFGLEVSDEIIVVPLYFGRIRGVDLDIAQGNPVG